MLLTIDIGNTNVALGVYDGERVVFVSRLASERSKTPDQYAAEFKRIFELYSADVKKLDSSIIGSVVPDLTVSVKEAVEKLIGREPLVLGPGLKTGMNILIDNPALLGADLLAGCVGAAALYPTPCLVVDLGTASKISVVDRNGAFRGCVIAPGVGISLEALSAKTSQLPYISLAAPRNVIGKNSVDSMRSGIVFGFSSMIDGLCEKLEAELNEGEVCVAAVGGYAKNLIKSCKRKIIYNEELVLYGLKLIYDKNRK